MKPVLTDARRTALLTGNLRRTLFVLSLPVLLEQFLNFCVGTYDTFLAGHLPGDINEVATGAVGVGAYVGWLASMIFSLVAAGTTAMVSRARGAGDDDEADRVANNSFTLAVVAGFAFLALILPLAPHMARVLVRDETAIAVTTRYLRIDAIGLLFSSVSFVGAAALRGCGNMRTPMWILGTVSVLNVIVSTSLVYGVGPLPPMGVDGIVTGTVIARTSGGLLMTGALLRGVSGIRLRPNMLHLERSILRRILTIGIPAAADGAVMWSGHFVFLAIIGGFGNASFAAHIIGIRLEAITYLPAVAWGVATATMIGQSLGAGNVDRARRAGHEGVLQCGLLGALITLVFFTGAEPIYRLMTNSDAVVTIGAPAFRMVALFQVPLVVSIVYISGLRGAGDTRLPLFITLCCTFGLRLPLAYLCGVVLEGGLYGAWIGMCIDMLGRCVLAAVRFGRGQWVQIRV